MNSIALSHNSSNYELNSETLDKLYKEQLAELRNVIFKHTDSADIELFRRWLVVFNRTSNADKLARNCLCTLMQYQLKEANCLQEPFTNLENCNKSLEAILRGLDEETSRHCSNFTMNTIQTIRTQFGQDLIQQQPSGTAVANDNNRSKLSAIAEQFLNESSIEIMQMQQELQDLRMQLTEKNIAMAKIQEVNENLYLEKEHSDNELINLKKSILDSICEKLVGFNEIGLHSKLNLFERIFENFQNDEKFMEIIRRCDYEFQHILIKYFEREFKRHRSLIYRKVVKQFDKSRNRLRESFQRRLAVQTANTELQVQLAQLNCFSILRQLLINLHNEVGKIDIWEILKILEDKYRSILSVL